MKTPFAAILLLLVLTAVGSACPFCTPSSSDVYTIADNSNAVCKVARVSRGKFKILQVLKGKATVGKVVLAGEPQVASSNGQQVLLLSTISNPAQPYWSEPVRSLSLAEYTFVKSLLGAPSDNERRDLAAKHLLSRSEIIEESAYNILAVSPLGAVQKRAHLTGRAALAKAATDASRAESRKSIYLLMILPSVTGADAGWLKELLYKPKPNPKVDYLPPLMAAYADASGGSAVKEMAEVFLSDRVSVTDSFNPTAGFTFIGSGAKNSKTREAARAVIRKEVANPDRGMFVIAPLAEWGDYSVAEEVEQLAYRNAETPWVVGSAVRYFRSFESKAAKEALQRLSNQFPKIAESHTKPY